MVSTVTVSVSVPAGVVTETVFVVVVVVAVLVVEAGAGVVVVVVVTAGVDAGVAVTVEVADLFSAGLAAVAAAPGSLIFCPICNLVSAEILLASQIFATVVSNLRAISQRESPLLTV